MPFFSECGRLQPADSIARRWNFDSTKIENGYARDSGPYQVKQRALKINGGDFASGLNGGSHPIRMTLRSAAGARGESRSPLWVRSTVLATDVNSGRGIGGDTDVRAPRLTTQLTASTMAARLAACAPTPIHLLMFASMLTPH